MAITRNTNTLEEASSPAAILELNQSAREGKVLGIGLCGLNPSGCHDIAKGISLQFQNVPFVRVQYDAEAKIMAEIAIMFHMLAPKQTYQFLDTPPQFNANVYDTVFFTGCGMDSSSMSSILNSLSQQYQFTNIHNVYQIVPPHHPKGMPGYESDMEKTLQSFKNSPYQYRFAYSGVDNCSPSNIGMPRFESKPSDFKIPLECYGVIRHRNVNDFLTQQNNECSPEVEKYLNEYFRQVAYAGKDCVNKPIMVIGIGIESKYRQRMIEIAKKHSVVIDFCDQYSDNRLPHQDDFFKVLTTMKDRKGVVSFDDTSTQCLLQALSFGAPVMIYSHAQWPEFYTQLVNLVPIAYQPTARVILGLDGNFELLKDRVICQAVYELLHAEVNKSHQKFDNFKNSNLAPVIAVANGDVNAAKVSLPRVSSKIGFFSPIEDKTKQAAGTTLSSSTSTIASTGNSSSEDAEAVNLFFQDYGNKCNKRSFLYGKDAKDITLTRIVENAKGNNKKSIFAKGKSYSGFTSKRFLIKHFGVNKHDICNMNVDAIRKQILKSKKPENSLQPCKNGR